MPPLLILDLSRLLWRSRRNVPTGIDRVELEYAKHYIATSAESLDFVATTLTGRSRFLPRRLSHDFVAALDRVWQGDPAQARPARALAMRLRMALLFGAADAAPMPGAIYLHVSHHHLDRPKTIARFRRETGARFVCMIHDLIPIEWPEYARPNHDRRHTRRMETVAAQADAIILNSAATGRSFQPFLDRIGRVIPVAVALLGVTPPPLAAVVPTAPAAGPPYFVMIGTIEPRKNHLMLLALWRELANDLGAQAPRLILIGQRGWENENIVDLLDRSPPLRRSVTEYNSLADDEMAGILAGARALLLPSFAEGYGLPVAEALCAGIPVICTPLPALREIGGDVPDYRDALDGAGWRAAILDYAAPKSPLRAAQLERLAGWRAPRWEDHFVRVDTLIAEIAEIAAAR
jgi:glycosyltransferase involved in cell wall biosynthesis